MHNHIIKSYHKNVNILSHDLIPFDLIHIKNLTGTFKSTATCDVNDTLLVVFMISYGQYLIIP